MSLMLCHSSATHICPCETS